MAKHLIIPPPEFVTKRLLLRLPVRGDARPIFEGYAQELTVTRHLPWMPHRDIGETRAFLRRVAAARKEDREYTWSIVLRRTGAMIGMIALRVSPPKADFGYVLAPAHWNRGYATEAAAALAGWALAQAPIHRVWAVVETGNSASSRVLEKIGMRREGTLLRWMYHSGSETPVDCHCYSLVKGTDIT